MASGQPHAEPLSSPLSTPEMKATVCSAAIPVPPVWIKERYGSYTKLLAINAWCIRFVSNLKCKRQKLPLVFTPFFSADAQPVQASSIRMFSGL